MTRPSSLADLATIFDSQSISGTRNRIINGAMDIAQRATTATGAYTSTYTYVSLDRWAVFSPNSSTTLSRSTEVPAGFRNSLRIQRPSGNTGTSVLLVGQAIESVNVYDLSSQSVTLSFWARAGANFSAGSSLVTFQVVTGTAADQGIGLVDTFTGRAVPINQNLNLTTTWTRYTLVGTFGAGVQEAVFQFQWFPIGTAGADDSVYITGVQLEAGPFATPFERRSFGQELALCQRYYQRSNAGAANGFSLNGGDGLGFSHPTSNFRGGAKFPVTMRGTPTLTIFDDAGNSGRVSLFTGSWLSNQTIGVGPVATATGFYLGHNIANSIETQYAYVASAEL